MKLKKWLIATGFALISTLAQAAELPRVAVTDFAVEDKVREYFLLEAASSSRTTRGSASEKETDNSYRARSRFSEKEKSDYLHVEGTYTRIDRGELRKFSSDVRGEMLKSRQYRLVEAKPFLSSGKKEVETEKIYDVIERIKKGYFPNATHVMFGTVSNVEWRQESQPVQGSDAVNNLLSLELVVDFSLINTKTYEITAAFSAIGEGSDARLTAGRGERVHLSSSRVMYDVSKSLGKNVAQELENFYGLPVARNVGGSVESYETERSSSEKVIIYR